jgi:hypothetical protein
MIFYLAEPYLGQAFPCLWRKFANPMIIQDDRFFEKTN